MGVIRDFKPALMFLSKFLGIYLAGNVLYGIFIESYGTDPDILTRIVTAQSSLVLNTAGYETTSAAIDGYPMVGIFEGDRAIVNVFEGCNGVNVMIVFLGFLIAFGGPLRSFVFFIPAGLVIIHACNLLRISLLFDLAVKNSTQFYYFHKYFFTASLYLIVFGLWAYWIHRSNEKQNRKAPA